MDVAALVLFASTLLVAAASPGPGVAALVAQVVGRGSRGAGAFAAGLILGEIGRASCRERVFITV